ncbi:MAG: GGDEF domain-containing protein [Caldimonas sp.]
MSASQLRVLAVASAARAAGFAVEASPGWREALERLGGDDDAFDAVLVDGDAAPASPAEIAAVAERVALVVAVVEPDAEHALGWLRGGADDVIGRDELAGAAGWRRIRFAVERRRRRDLGRSAYSTDPGTGLPHRQQLVEHLSQLLALREREPAPMAVLGFRVEGLRPLGAGAESTDFETLRRKIAVRLRAGVRASDVVAAVDDDSFAVLLGSILTAADADRVAAKLVAALLAPFSVGTLERSVAVAFGIAQYPLDGRDAERLLRRALALAAAAPATAEAGPATARDAGGGERAAANDER